MSKDGSKKSPVPSDDLGQFICMLEIQADRWGILDIAEISPYVDCLIQAIGRYKFESKHKVSPQKKVHQDRKRFIAIFKARYLESMDLDYKNTITSTEGRVISQTIKMLKGEGFTADEYLKWVFEEFLVDNPRFKPTTIKAVCGQHMTHTFLVKNEHIRKERKQQDVVKVETDELLSRARQMVRSGEMSKDDKQKVMNTLKGFSERSIMLSGLRSVIQDMWKKYDGKSG